MMLGVPSCGLDQMFIELEAATEARGRNRKARDHYRQTWGAEFAHLPHAFWLLANQILSRKPEGAPDYCGSFASFERRAQCLTEGHRPTDQSAGGDIGRGGPKQLNHVAAIGQRASSQISFPRLVRSRHRRSESTPAGMGQTGWAFPGSWCGRLCRTYVSAGINETPTCTNRPARDLFMLQLMPRSALFLSTVHPCRASTEHGPQRVSSCRAAARSNPSFYPVGVLLESITKSRSSSSHSR